MQKNKQLLLSPPVSCPCSESSITIANSGSPQRLRSRPVLNLIRRVRRRSWSVTEERGTKNRSVINGYLRSIGSSLGKDLVLSEAGYCYFQFKKFIIVVEVPPENGGFVYFYTMVCRLGSKDNRAAVMQEAMLMNYMQQRTRGATLGLENNEVNLCFSVPVCSITREEFGFCLDDFMHTAEEMNDILDLRKKNPK